MTLFIRLGSARLRGGMKGVLDYKASKPFYKLRWERTRSLKHELDNNKLRIFLSREGDEKWGREKEGRREGGEVKNAQRPLDLTMFGSSLLRSKYLNPSDYSYSYSLSRCVSTLRLSSLRTNLVPRARINRRYYSSIWIKLLLCGGRLFPALHGITNGAESKNGEPC